MASFTVRPMTLLVMHPEVGQDIAMDAGLSTSARRWPRLFLRDKEPDACRQPKGHGEQQHHKDRDREPFEERFRPSFPRRRLQPTSVDGAATT